MDKKTGFITKLFHWSHKTKEKSEINQKKTKKSTRKPDPTLKNFKKKIKLSKAISFKQSYTDVMKALDEFDLGIGLTDYLCAKDLAIYMQITLDKIKEQLEQNGITHIDVKEVKYQGRKNSYERSLLVFSALCHEKESRLVFDLYGNFAVNNHDQSFCDFAELVSNELQDLCVWKGISILPTLCDFVNTVLSQANWVNISDAPAECTYFNSHRITVEQLKEDIRGLVVKPGEHMIDIKYNGKSFYKGSLELFAKPHVSESIYGDITETILKSLGYEVIDDRVTMSLAEEDLNPYDPDEERRWNLYEDLAMLEENYYDSMMSDFYDSYR